MSKPYERFSRSNPNLSLGWVVCTIDQADSAEHAPGTPCGYWHITYQGKRYKRPDTYSDFSPFDWELVEDAHV